MRRTSTCEATDCSRGYTLLSANSRSRPPFMFPKWLYVHKIVVYLKEPATEQRTQRQYDTDYSPETHIHEGVKLLVLEQPA